MGFFGSMNMASLEKSIWVHSTFEWGLTKESGNLLVGRLPTDWILDPISSTFRQLPGSSSSPDKSLVLEPNVSSPSYPEWGVGTLCRLHEPYHRSPPHDHLRDGKFWSRSASPSNMRSMAADKAHLSAIFFPLRILALDVFLGSPCRGFMWICCTWGSSPWDNVQSGSLVVWAWSTGVS